MDLVVDASVIIAIVTNEATKPDLIKATTGTNLIAPVSVHFQISNAFSAMLKRQHITTERVRDALVFYQEIPIRYLEIELPESLNIAGQLGIYAYDAYLIRFAERYSSPLLTLDKALGIHAKRYGLQLVDFKT